MRWVIRFGFIRIGRSNCCIDYLFVRFQLDSLFEVRRGVALRSQTFDTIQFEEHIRFVKFAGWVIRIFSMSLFQIFSMSLFQVLANRLKLNCYC